MESAFYMNNTIIENVKTMKYLGFIITVNNCSFLTTLQDLRIKANALNTNIKISTLPTKLALKVFNMQIKPVLLYEPEVWGPCMG